jgi:aminoglycoside phosphotransferase (APT) family kinase protein
MPFDRIPSSQRDAVAQAVRQTFGSAGAEAITPASAGLSGAFVARLQVRGRPYLLRVEAHRDALRDPHRQYACMRAAAEAGVAPAVLHTDPEVGVAITDFIDARPIADYPGGAPAAALELGRMTARLRAGPAFPTLVDYFDGVDLVWANLLSAGAVDPDAIAPYLAAWKDVRDVCPRTPAQALVPSHNDPNPSNILYDGERLWLIDWETAFANDPLVDPAILAMFFGLEGPAEAPFLEAVFGAVDEALTARFLLVRQACHMFFAAMMLTVGTRGQGAREAPIADFVSPDFAVVRAAVARGELQVGSPEGRLALAKAMLGRVLATTQGPALEAAARRLA